MMFVPESSVLTLIILSIYIDHENIETGINYCFLSIKCGKHLFFFKMNFLQSLSFSFLILTANLVDLSLAQNRCDQLPLEVADLQLIIQNSPVIDHFALSPIFNCTQQVMSFPAKGTTGYDGTALVVQRTNALVYQFTMAADGKSADSTICATGLKETWNFLKFQETASGGYFCIFVCDADGINFSDFVCGATDSSYIDAETQALSLVSGIPNAASIYDAHSNCPAPQNCAIFT